MPFSCLSMSSRPLKVCVMCRSVKFQTTLDLIGFFVSCRCINMPSDTAICKSMCELGLFVFFFQA